MDSPVTKRLHISGLTPSLTAADLSKRLSSFGTVKALDGFGLVDGLGQPKAFGYVTIETTTNRLAKCLNILSGSMWKGAKLRIGEARPDYAERLARERERSQLEPPKKKPRRACGTEAPDMSLVTPENVGGRGGWKVTPMGRIVRPVRMRPERPLPNVAERKISAKGKAGGEEKMGQKKSRKRERRQDTRARRRTIDPTRWDSTHLKGVLLDVVTTGAGKDLTNQGLVYEDEHEESEVSEESEVDELSAAQQQQIKLKDLFAPREEAGFSLLEHLNPDLELDDEAVVLNFSTAQSPAPAYHNAHSTPATSYIPTLAPSRAARIDIDPRQPLFFPLSSTGTKGRAKDLFDVARDNGWSWRDPTVGFYRTDAEEDIRGQWERGKVELTREWKKRSREAGKMRKRRGGADGD